MGREEDAPKALELGDRSINSMTFQSKSQKDFLVNINKLILKYRWKWKEPRIATIILRRTNLEVLH